MPDRDIEDLKNIANRLRNLNAKIKLISLLNKAHSEYEQNKLKESETTCREILKTEPENPIALRGLGCIFQEKGIDEKALEYYKKALINSNNKEIELTLIGTVYYLQDNFEEAIKYYNLAIDTNDNYDPAYEGRNQSMLEKHLKIADLQDSLIKRNIF